MVILYHTVYNVIVLHIIRMFKSYRVFGGHYRNQGNSGEREKNIMF